MMTKKGFAIWTTTLVGLAVAQSGHASTIEREVDASVGGVIPINYGDHTINSSIASTGTGSYSFEAQAGDAVRIVTAGSRYIDPSIELRDSSGEVLNSASCSTGTGSCSTSLDETIVTTGTHYINVWDGGRNESGSYTMHFDLYPPSDPTGNNWDGLGYYSLVSDTFGHSGDHDMFGFWGASGTGISVSVDGGRYIDPHLEIWGPSGEPALYDNYCSTGTGSCSVSASLDLTEDGLYLLALSDAGFNETGGYNLQLACTYGDCPVDRAAPPVPVPAAFWLFASALGFTGVWFRKRNPSA